MATPAFSDDAIEMLALVSSLRAGYVVPTSVVQKSLDELAQVIDAEFGLHVDIINGKVWIQRDGTEEGIALELVAAGIPKEHIVLAFHHPSRRPDTEYAVA